LFSHYSLLQRIRLSRKSGQVSLPGLNLTDADIQMRQPIGFAFVSSSLAAT
jgi:hypothetical protein